MNSRNVYCVGVVKVPRTQKHNLEKEMEMTLWRYRCKTSEGGNAGPSCFLQLELCNTYVCWLLTQPSLHILRRQLMYM